ncbi:MAG: hypothetical protein AAF998_08855 [Bacteroidota bacterium]
MSRRRGPRILSILFFFFLLVGGLLVTRAYYPPFQQWLAEKVPELDRGLEEITKRLPFSDSETSPSDTVQTDLPPENDDPPGGDEPSPNILAQKEIESGRKILAEKRTDYEQKLRDALYHFVKAYEYNPQSKMARLEAGRVRIDLGEYQRAIEDFDRATSLDDHFGEAYFQRARCYSEVGPPEMACRDYRAAYANGVVDALEFRNDCDSITKAKAKAL